MCEFLPQRSQGDPIPLIVAMECLHAFCWVVTDEAFGDVRLLGIFFLENSEEPGSFQVTVQFINSVHLESSLHAQALQCARREIVVMRDMEEVAQA